MLDQSFSPKNFRTIYDIENRKGNYLDGRFFPDLALAAQDVQKKKYTYEQIKAQKNTLTDAKYLEELEKRGEELRTARELRETKINIEMENVSKSASKNNLNIGIKKIDIGTGKVAFTIKDNAPAYFSLRQIQHNFRRIYKVKQSNRHHVICQLREVLSDNFSKYVVKTDIKSFYESISRQKLVDKINRDPYLSVNSKKIIKEILFEYGSISGNTKGIPRGIGLSAYLSELYLREFDDKISNFPGVVYYARYVDDIILILCPPANSSPFEIKPFLLDELDLLEMKYNPKKTDAFSSKRNDAFNFDYLGYKIMVKKSKVSIGLSDNKKDRYKKRIDLAFSDYAYQACKSEKKSRELLIGRIKFLTGNTRLVNNKKNVVSGIYFSNSLVCHEGVDHLKELDVYLKQKCTLLKSPHLARKIRSMSFVNGFENIVFWKFKYKDFQKIVRVWKYAR